MTEPTNIPLIEDLASLHGTNGKPNPRTLAKKLKRIDHHATRFIEQSPFLLLATRGDDGCDASPRGDGPGFVKVLDDTTLLIPERPGTRIADSLRNILATGEVGLLFLIPGLTDTLRVNGRAWITDHAPYLEQLTERGKQPKLAIVIHVEELYFHCPKAFIRSSLWNPETFADKGAMPSLGRIILEHVTGETATEEAVSEIDQRLEEDVRDNLY